MNTWREDLAQWAIPQAILDQAPENPWIHPVSLFTVPDEILDAPGHAAAREALPEGGSVLDVGCGGGIAAMALADRAALLIGVDHQQAMLDEFSMGAQKRSVACQTILGDWPDVAPNTPEADVVVCHHVAYNVANIEDFLRELSTHARRRVVLQIPTQHPLTLMAPLWQRFWDLSRPQTPTASDLLAICREMGFDAHMTTWPDESPRLEVPLDEQVRFNRIRLCLPESRDPEVAEAMNELPKGPRQLAAIWWDNSE